MYFYEIIYILFLVIFFKLNFNLDKRGIADRKIQNIFIIIILTIIIGFVFMFLPVSNTEYNSKVVSGFSLLLSIEFILFSYFYKSRVNFKLTWDFFVFIVLLIIICCVQFAQLFIK